MKKYIILTPNVCGMGGAELYTLRRANHLIDRGYDVFIMVAFHKDFFPLKDKLKSIPICVFPELDQYPCGLTKRHVKETLEKMRDAIGKDEELYIESHTLYAIVWGELLSQKLSARHLAYPLSEHKLTNYRFKLGRKIFENKLIKNEFYGCFSNALKIIFDRDDVPNNYVNIGFDERELSDRSEPALNLLKTDKDFVITTVGRLDKTYVEPFIDQALYFVKKHPQFSFILLIGGGSQVEGREEYLKKKYEVESKKLHNLKLIFTGYIDVLGKDLFHFSDVFVGLGTASINALSQKCITINIDPRNGMKYSSGFFGIDTNNFAYSENGKLYSISEKIEEAFLMSDKRRDEVRNEGRKLFDDEFQINVCFDKLDRVIEFLEPVETNSFQDVSFIYRMYVCLGLFFYNMMRKQ